MNLLDDGVVDFEDLPLIIGLVPYFDGEVSVQTFEKLTSELLSSPWAVPRVNEQVLRPESASPVSFSEQMSWPFVASAASAALKVAGIVQTGSGLVVNSDGIRSPSHKAGYCTYSDYNEYGNTCSKTHPCEDNFLQSSMQPMYDKAVAEGFDVRLIEVPGGSHKNCRTVRPQTWPPV